LTVKVIFHCAKCFMFRFCALNEGVHVFAEGRFARKSAVGGLARHDRVAAFGQVTPRRIGKIRERGREKSSVGSRAHVVHAASPRIVHQTPQRLAPL
jgi:hypothetical protein